MKKTRTHLHDLDQETREQILDLYPAHSIRKISKALGISRKLILNLLEKENRLIPRSPFQSHKLDPFKKLLQEKVEKGLTAARIHWELKELGYQGGRTILAQEVSRLRTQYPLSRSKPAKRRFETLVGKEIQVDWSPGTVKIAGKLVNIHVLGMVLAHCRKLFYAVFQQERLPILIEGLARGFEYFGGGTEYCVFDNMSTIVLGKIGPDREPLWTSRFIDFCRHYGFEPFLCKVRDPDRKGKKEKAFRLVFADFLKGSEFESWEDLQKRLSVWLDRTPERGNLRNHGTTGLVPNEVWLQEKPFLARLPEHRFPVYEKETREVDQDSTISVKGIRYTVPSVLANRQAIVRLYADHFEVFDPQGRLHLSRSFIDTSIDPRKLVIDSTHYAGLKRRPVDSGGKLLDQAFVERFPTLVSFVDGLKRAMKSIAGIHLRHLLRLAHTYGQTDFLAAATKAQMHKRFDSYAVKRILEAEHPIPPEDLTATCGGVGPLLLGEVEETDLDAYAHLDTIPASEKDDDNENT